MSGIEFAPWNTPLRRRLQTLAAFAWITVILVGAIFGWVLVAALYFFCPSLRSIVFLYVAWCIYDRKAGETGDRRWPWVRRWAWWKYFAEYFPVTVIKTAELPPDNNYLLATFPHGILSSAAFSAFATDWTNFQELFPGIKASFLTLEQHFITPLIRELALSIGNLPASKASITRALRSTPKGQALALMVGGAKESYYTKPGVYKIYVKDRKGFVRAALENKAPLVPVMCFGEPELYDQVEFTGFWKDVQDGFKSLTGVAPILFLGRGVFQYSFGIVPRRHPLNVVVGKPMDVPEGPITEELVNKVHEKFIENLKDLFDKHKLAYIDPKTELIIV